MIKLVVVGFYFIGGWGYSEWQVWDLIILVQFQRSEFFPGLFQDFLDGYIKPKDSLH